MLDHNSFICILHPAGWLQQSHNRATVLPITHVTVTGTIMTSLISHTCDLQHACTALLALTSQGWFYRELRSALVDMEVGVRGCGVVVRNPKPALPMTWPCPAG